MTYEERKWLQSEIEAGGWIPYTEYSDRPLNGEIVEIIALDMDSRIHQGKATYTNPVASAEYFLGITLFSGLRVARIQAWRRCEESKLSYDNKYICDGCEYGPQHKRKWQKCTYCRFNRNLKDNHKWAADESLPFTEKEETK